MDVIHFDGTDSAPVALVGGKGANLVALTRGAFPVPPGFVVTAEAYRKFLASAQWLKPLVDGLDYGSAEKLRDQCSEIRKRSTIRFSFYFRIGRSYRWCCWRRSPP